MHEYDEAVIRCFLENQGQLFDKPVAETVEEADDFLVDCLAEVVDSIDEVRECLDEFGMDMSDLDDEELAEAAEVFAMPDGKFLVVEG
jgi:phage-related minor tail protein